MSDARIAARPQMLPIRQARRAGGLGGTPQSGALEENEGAW